MDHADREGPQHGVSPRRPPREAGVAVPRPPMPHVVVGARALGGRARIAQDAALGPAERHVLAAREVRHPPVQEVAVVRGEGERPLRRAAVPGGVADERERERRQKRERPHRPAAHDRKHERGRDQRQAHRPRQAGGGEQHARRDADGDGGPAAPQEHAQGGGDQQREERLREDVLLDVQLVRVEQDGRSRDAGPDRADAEPAHEGVHQHAGGEAQQVLHRRDGGQVVDHEHGPQKRRVSERPDRLRLEPGGVLEVGERVAVEEERRPVRDLHDDAQRCRGHEQRGEQPVAGDDPHRGRRERPCPARPHSRRWWVWEVVTGCRWTSSRTSAATLRLTATSTATASAKRGRRHAPRAERRRRSRASSR